MNHLKTTIVAIMLTGLLIVISAAQSPILVNYQGYLTDAEGQALSGEQQITFLLYEQLEGGVELWKETQTVTMENGLFNVLLGNADSSLSISHLGGERYLGIKIGEDDELEPRMRLASVTHSVTATQAEGAYTLNAPNDGPANAVYVDENGNVGVGTTTPGSTLDVKGEMLADNMMIKIHEGVCTNVNAYTIKGLNGNLHKIYKLYFHGTMNDGETYLMIRPNSDDSAVNYQSWLRHIGNATGVNGALFGLYLTRSWVSVNDVSGEVTLFCETSATTKRQRFSHGQAFSVRNGYDGNSLAMYTAGRWKNNTDNITELKITQTNSAGLSIGTFSGRFIVYALRAR